MPGERHCGDCGESVTLCSTVGELHDLAAAGRCVAVAVADPENAHKITCRAVRSRSGAVAVVGAVAEIVGTETGAAATDAAALGAAEAAQGAAVQGASDPLLACCGATERCSGGPPRREVIAIKA